MTQVLDESTPQGHGTNTYLYGNGRIAQLNTDTLNTDYFLGDALGSVRQMTDASGTVTLTQSYDPYGEVLSTTGEAQTSYGYTGEYTDPTGMVYLRARYYAPNIGRFIARDVWEGDAYSPVSYNAWLYGIDNPLRYTDPSGNIPECDEYSRADLTQWLIDEMNTTRKSNLASTIRLFIDPSEPDIYGKGIAWLLFYDSVKTNGLFDFKWRINEKIGPNIRLAGNWYNYMAPGNMHFAYFGVSVGFDRKTLHCGADFANNHKWCSGADETEDYEAIEVGADLYTLSGGGDVNKQMFELALALHPLANPGVQSRPYATAYSLTWPYPIGTFDDGSKAWLVKHR